MSRNDLIRVVAAVGIALIAWPTALWALHGAFFRSGDTNGNGPLIFGGMAIVVALVATWVAVFLLSSSNE